VVGVRGRIRDWFVEEGGKESTERIYAYQTGESCPVRVFTTSFFSRSTTSREKKKNIATK